MFRFGETCLTITAHYLWRQKKPSSTFFFAFIVISDKALNSLYLCEHKVYDWPSPQSLVCQVHLIKTLSWSEYRNRGRIICEDVYRTVSSTKALRMNKYIYCTLLYYFEKRLVEIQRWIITFFSSLFFPFPSFLYPFVTIFPPLHSSLRQWIKLCL